MEFIYYFSFLLISFLIIRSTFFKRQKLIFKILIFLAYLIFWFILTLAGFVYLWNSSDDYHYEQRINSTEIENLNTSNR